jgi:SAM-dependent methyltransferase
MNFKSIVYWKLVYPVMIRFDRYQGLDFLPAITAKSVGLDITRSFGYSPTHKRFLAEVLNDFCITSNDAVIDVGCGKGSAMRTMLKYPFAKVDGIELSIQIANIAKQNFEKLKVNRSKIYTSDAGLFREFDAYNYVYFFNPFPAVVMEEVVENLIESVRQSERELIIIYMSPTCTDVIVKRGIFKLIGIYKKSGAWITVYSNRSIENSKLASNKFMHRSLEGSAIDNALKLYLENFSQPDYLDL